MNIRKTCCFIGDRRLPIKKMEYIVKRLSDEIDDLIEKGITDFISGGGLGFEQIAASMIVAKKEMGHNIRLIFALPYRSHNENWSAEQQKLYHNLLGEADEVRCVSEEYIAGYMKKRNHYMVNNSAYCICAMQSAMNTTGQAIRYAQQKGVMVINILK